MGWQWHQLDDMQIICTLLKTVNHASTSPLSFYRPDALFDSQPTLSKPRRQSQITGNENVIFTASMFGLHQEPVWCWGLRFPTANNMEQTACSTTYTAVIQAVSVTAATAPALMKHILRLVNYCKNTTTSTQPTFLPRHFGLYRRPSSEEVCSIPLPVLATSHHYRGKNRKRNWTNFFWWRSLIETETSR